MKLRDFTISEILKSLRKKEFSCKELVLAYLEEIKKKDKEIGAYVEIAEKVAIEQAKELDSNFEFKKNLLLFGVPTAIKDNILVKGLKCTAGSKILKDFLAPYDATCIKKLKEKGAIILGKTNLDEFAMGSSTEHSAFQLTRNPYDLERVPGGSSGGSAAAVSANECCFALGSDTGGSIRQPASFCGIVGLKPTYGAVSRYGLIAFGSSLDQIGPLTKTIDDAEIVFEIIKGKDELDSTSFYPEKLENTEFLPEKVKIGIVKEFFEKSEKKVKEVLEKLIKKLEDFKIKFLEISLPYSEYALACYYIIATSEASANLARYDGVRYSKIKEKSTESEKDLFQEYFFQRKEGFGEEVKRRIILGTFSLSSGYYQAYYLKAQKVRTLIAQDFKTAFEKVDFILTPTSPFLPFKIGEKIQDPIKMYLADIFTVSVNLAGLPAISLLGGKVENLPVGVQIIGNYFQEKKIFEIGRLIEKIQL